MRKQSVISVETHLRLLGPDKKVLPNQERLLHQSRHLGDLRPDLSGRRGHPPEGAGDEIVEGQDRRVLRRRVVGQAAWRDRRVSPGAECLQPGYRRLQPPDQGSLHGVRAFGVGSLGC